MAPGQYDQLKKPKAVAIRIKEAGFTNYVKEATGTRNAIYNPEGELPKKEKLLPQLKTPIL